MYLIEINALVLIAFMLLAFGLGWAYCEWSNRSETTRLNAENAMLWEQVLPEYDTTSQPTLFEVPKLQPHRGASRDRSLPGKARRTARKAANRVG